MPKTVQLSDRAYAALSAIKKDGESFSDVVHRLLAERRDPLALLNLGPPDAAWDYEEVRTRMDAADRRKMRKLHPGQGW